MSDAARSLHDGVNCVQRDFRKIGAIREITWPTATQGSSPAGFKKQNHRPGGLGRYAAARAAPGDVGNDQPYAGTGRLEEIGWFEANGSNKTHPVGGKQPNGFGLHDMYGNVFEQCEDVDNSSFYSTPEAGRLDPVCTSGSESRVMRGGAFINDRRPLRGGIIADGRGHIIGFRVVASPPP
jgi:formylglycine-generating enzyme required for sulfatase activity